MRQSDTATGVLIPDSRSGKCVSCVRSLGSKNVRTVVATEDPVGSAAGASKYCDETVRVPSPHDNILAYKNALLSFAGRDDINAIIPAREEDAFVLSKYRSEFANHVAPIWPPFETLATVQDGIALAEVARDLDIPVPETTTFDEVTDWDRELILKARYSILTDSYVDFLEPENCEGQIPPVHHSPGPPPDRDAVLDRMLGHVPLVQSYVPIDSEYSVRAMYDEGEAVATSVRKQIRGMSYAGGVSVFRELVENERVETLAKRLLDHLEWHGLATVQFIKTDGADSYTLLEVNPRIWTSLPLDVQAGADYPYFYWLLATDEREQIEPGHETGYANHLLYGELMYLDSVLRGEYENADRPGLTASVKDIAVSLYRHPNFDYLDRDDPQPFVRAIRNRVAGGY